MSYSVLRQGKVTSCALTSSRLDDFFDIVTYILAVINSNIFWDEAGHFFLRGGGSFYPSNTLDRTLITE